MGLLNLTQIACHHVLANEIVLNLKYHIGIKHFFNINLGISIIKKLLFLFVFSTCLSVFLHKFRSGELFGAPLKRLKLVGWLGPATSKTRNTWKSVMMMSSSHFFRYFLFLGLRRPSRVCWVGTRWMWNWIPHLMSSPSQNLSNNIGRYVENTNKKVVFSFLPPKLLNIILLF